MNKKKYSVSVHAIFRQETRWLKEWLEYHLMIGVEHFYLFCDDDAKEADEVNKVLFPKYESVITICYSCRALDKWPRDLNFQLRPIRELLNVFGHETEWLAVLDLDEFIFPYQPIKLSSILNRYEKPEINGLHIPCCTFGSNGLKFPPELQIEGFVRRGKDNCFANMTAKNFYRPEMVKEYFSIKDEKHKNKINMYDTNFEPNPGGKVLRPSNILRVNHYGCRSQEDWQKKMTRGNPWVNNKQDWADKLKRYDVNDIYDDSMLIYIPELRKRMGL